MRFPKWPRWVWRCYAATFAAVWVFLICSFWPMWWVSEGGNGWIWEGNSGSLWWMLTYKPDSWAPGPVVDVSYQWQGPACCTAVAMHIAAIVGAILGGVRWRKGEETSPPPPVC